MMVSKEDGSISIEMETLEPFVFKAQYTDEGVREYKIHG